MTSRFALALGALCLCGSVASAQITERPISLTPAKAVEKPSATASTDSKGPTDTIAKAKTLTPAMPAADSVRSFPEDIERKKLLESTKIVYINSDDTPRPSADSVRNLINNFYVNQFRHFMDPNAPYLMFVSKDTNLAMGIGGRIAVRGVFDWKDVVPANGFAPALIPIPGDPTRQRAIKAIPSGTCLFFSLLGKDPRLGNYTAYIEANFNGYNHEDFMLKKAYVSFRDWTVGYATSTFSDPAAIAPTVDGAGPNGHVSKTNVLVRYMHSFKKNWTVAGSVEFPSSHIQDQDGYTKKCSDWMPDLAAFMQYQWDGGLSHLRLSGLMRTISYRDLIAERNLNEVGFGVMLSSVVKVCRPLSLYGEVSYGRGNGSYLNDLSIVSVDLVADPGNPGRLYQPRAMGLTFGAKYNFTDNIFASVTLSEQQYYARNPRPAADYRYGLYGEACVYWQITPRVLVGAEYIAGKRVNNDHTHGNSNRVDATFQLSF